jgi:uncharacterized protein YndB with AHSA1/START domain
LPSRKLTKAIFFPSAFMTHTSAFGAASLARVGDGPAGGKMCAVPVDVVTKIEIECPPDLVSAYASNPDNTTSWYRNIESARWKSDPPLAVGSLLEFVARFLGRRLAYSYEVTELVPGERLVMRTADGPFPMETTYTWTETATGGTKMTLRNRGEPAGFAKITAPVLEAAMRRANRKDLELLKETLERPGG